MKVRQHAASLALMGLAVAAGAAFLFEQGKVTDSERRDRVHDVFPAYRRADIDSITLVQGQKTLHIERRPDSGDAGETHWQMTSPVDELADPAAVDRFIGDLEFAGAIRKVDVATAPDVARGFEPPRVTGTLSMKALVYHFALGGPAPIPEGAAYFRVDGEGTFVVSKDFVTSITNGPTTYRERNVVPYLSLDLAGLEVHTPEGGFTITRKDDVAFTIGDHALRASRDGLDKVWGALAEARAESFLTDKEADGAIGPSPIRVVLTPKDKAKPRGELLLGAECPGHADDVVFTRVSPTRESACVPKGALTGLRMTESALVDRHLFIARPDEVEEIVFETLPTGLVLELARKGHGWHERRPTDRDLGSAEVDLANDLVTKLTRGEAVSVDAGAPPFTPRAKVRVKRNGTDAEEVVVLGPTNEVAQRTFDGALLHLPPALGRRLVPSEIALRSRSVFPDGFGQAKADSLTTDCDGSRQSLTRSGDAWTMREPHGFTADGLATADLLGLVKNAQAESWVADADDGSYGLADSTCKVMATAGGGDGGTRAFGIVFGKEADEGTYYAKTTSDGAVFRAPRALREGPANWLIDRGGFRADPSAVLQVTLSRGKAHVTFPGRRADVEAGVADTASKVLSTLEVLRPEAVIHLGPAKPEEGFAAPSLDVRVKLAGEAGAREIHFVFGDTARVNGERLLFARVDGVDATYGIARDRVVALVEAL